MQHTRIPYVNTMKYQTKWKSTLILTQIQIALVSFKLSSNVLLFLIMLTFTNTAHETQDGVTECKRGTREKHGIIQNDNRNDSDKTIIKTM